ncbi:MAG TPA: ABC transporter permease, partial [Terriglobales bacterium]|nr:ABC transporter permease [Terriglobales bacterium]
MEFISPTEWAKHKVLAVQDYSILAWRSLTNLARKPRYLADLMQQADIIGVGSVPIIVLTGVSIGGSLALNTASSLQQFGVTSMTGQLVAISMVTEIGPILTALLVAGRNASGMASELGSMRVTEQIDAMRALGTDPSKKLVTPRVIAAVVMLVFLTIISDLFGLVGGWLVSRTMLGVNTYQYWTSTYQNLTFGEVVRGLVKPVIFGFV